MILLGVKVSGRTPVLLLLHVALLHMLHVVHSILVSHRMLGRISSGRTHQSLLLVVVVVWMHVVGRRIAPLLLLHASHHGLSVSHMVSLWVLGMLTILGMMLLLLLHVVVVVSAHVGRMVDHTCGTEGSHRGRVRSRRRGALHRRCVVVVMHWHHRALRCCVLLLFLFVRVQHGRIRIVARSCSLFRVGRRRRR